MKSRCYRHGCHRASHRALRPGLFQSPEQLSQRSSSFFTRCCIQLHTSSICKINPGRALRCTVFFPVRQKNITTGLFQFFMFLKAWRSKKNNEALTVLCHRIHIPIYFTSFLICEATEGTSCPSRLLAVTDHDKLICVSVDYHGRCSAVWAFIYLRHAYVVLLCG